jgi:purine-binding chemotaxis protein CheW
MVEKKDSDQQENIEVVEVYDDKDASVASSPDIQSTKIQHLLRKRAEILAAPKQEDEFKSLNYFLRFRVGPEEHYGVPYNHIREVIMSSQSIVTVPRVPEFIVGVMNHRSEILTVIDLKYWLNIERVGITADPWVIIVHGANVKLGILVDEVIGGKDYIPEELTTPIASADISNMEYIAGIYNGEVAMLNIEALLNNPILKV